LNVEGLINVLIAGMLC